MDLLKTFGMEDLPEQQTKTVHLMARHPEFSLRLGFDACCTCGSQFTPSSTVVECKHCHHVQYCSDACRAQDAQGNAGVEADYGDQEGEDPALGHSSVICALLKLCEADEAAEQSPKTDATISTSSSSDPNTPAAAIYRVISELESYPATLANVILQGPLYGTAIQSAVASASSSSSGKKFTIHIVGASQDGELWESHPSIKSKEHVFDAYAEALAELCDTRGLDVIELHFVGPECSTTTSSSEPISRSMKSVEGGVVGQLVARTHCREYTAQFLGEVTKADMVVFFNPGFTCPDYDWADALSCIPKGTPFLMTTNTELEGIADCQYLLDNDLIRSVPPMLAEVLGNEEGGPALMPDDDEDERNNNGDYSFFNENPFCGSRVRQSGTMANDLFVKNRWMLGGILDCQTSQPPNKRRVTESLLGSKNKTSNNTKASNPALI